MDKLKDLLPLTTILIWPLGLAAADAAADEPLETTELPPYVVVATRTPLSPDEVSPSVSVIEQDDLLFWQTTRLTDALKMQPGMVVAPSGAIGSQTSLFTRGTNSDHTSFFIDGRRLNPGFGNQFDLESLPASGFSSLQLLRGASSVNYGSSGIGGVVALETPRALDRSESTARAEGSAGANGYYQGTFDTTIAADRIGASFAGAYVDTQNERPNDDYENFNLSGRFDFKLAESLYFETVAFMARSTKEVPGSVVAPSPPGAAQESGNWLVSPGLMYDNGEQRVNLFYSRSRSDLEANAILTGRFDTRSEVESDEVNLQIDHPLVDSVLFSGGVVYRHDNAYRSDIGFFGPAVPYEQNFDQTGFWAQVLWEVIENVELRGGARYDNYSEFEDKFTGNAEVVFMIPDVGITLFGKAATSFAPPSASDVAFDGDPVTTALLPEEAVSYEAGVKHELFDDTVHWSAVVFYNDISELIDFVFVPPATFDGVNIDKAETSGIELAADFSPFESVTIGGGYTYLQAVDKSAGGGGRLVRRPRHTTQAWIVYQPIESVRIGADVLGYFDRKDIDPTTFATIQGDDVFVMNAVAEWEVVRHWTVFGRVENLLNRQYDAIAGFPALGRAWYAGLRASF